MFSKILNNDLNIDGLSAILCIKDINDIFKYKDIIDKSIDANLICVFTVIYDGQGSVDIPREQKLKLFQWLNSLEAISIIVLNSRCCGDLSELIMMFDIRLGGNDFTVEFPQDCSNFVFNFIERCELLMGKEGDVTIYDRLPGTIMVAEEAYNHRLINKVIDSEDVLGEVGMFVKKIIGNKDNYQIKSIIKCFTNYKTLGLNFDMDILKQGESEQFFNLIIKDYKKRLSNEV